MPATTDVAKSSSPSLMMLVLVATIGVLLYAQFLLNPSHRGDPLPYLLVIVAETWIIALALVSLWTILSSGFDPRGSAFHQARRALIQLIPMGPVSTHLGSDPERVRADVEEATADGYDVLFGDYLVMYLALADPQAALEQARDLPDERVDDGSTRSYLLAWVMAREAAS